MHAVAIGFHCILLHVCHFLVEVSYFGVFFSSIHLPLFLFIILLIFILFQLDSKFFGFLNVELKIKSFLL